MNLRGVFGDQIDKPITKEQWAELDRRAEERAKEREKPSVIVGNAEARIKDNKLEMRRRI